MAEEIKRRKVPNVWAKNLAKLLSGDNRCWYAAWMQANYWLPREDRTPEDQARMEGHMRAHDAITTRRAAELRADGWLVKVEDEGAFKVVGKRAELTGKPDIVGLRGTSGDQSTLIVDAKSGKRREGDAWQVLVYAFALPLSWLGDPGVITGEIAYSDANVPVRRLTTVDRREIVEGINRLSTPEPPEKTPGKYECGFCSLRETCPERFDEATQAGRTELF